MANAGTEGNRAVAGAVRHERKSPRASLGRQPAGGPKSTKRHGDDCNDARRFEVHSGEPGQPGTALVYIFRDGKGLTKVGFSRSLRRRIEQTHSTIPPLHRPIRLVRAVWMRTNLAYKAERLTQHLLERHAVKGHRYNLCEFKEWFSATPSLASKRLGQAIAAVGATADELGDDRFPWRKALPFLADDRIKGEWFTLSPAIKKCVAGLKAARKRKR